ncbi:MAG: cysteine hydrolase [Candidatus Pacebacteria bacterium]|nr:cysteine hydrolase [Candidatus Paceibacterota bacterium]MBP9772468.1 cysteine hydrolase [Candidatus Paceibacterota bacterium]
MGKEINLDNLLVLLIDMQEDFVANKYRKRKIIPNQVRILEFCNANLIPVVIFEFVGYGKTVEDITAVAENKSGNNVHFLEKKYDDAFYNPKLNSILESSRTKTILMMGVNAGFCVYETAKSAIENGYQVVTSRDLIAGYRTKWEKSPCPGVSWYQENTLFFDDHKRILKKIKNKSPSV